MANDSSDDTLGVGKGTKSAEKNEEIINELITKGEIQHLKQDEIIQQIRDDGIKISRRQYYRYKDKLFKLNEQRLLSMPVEYSSGFLRRIDTFKLAEKLLWEIFNKEDMEVRDKLSLIKQVTELQMPIQFFYNSGPIVNGMMEAIKHATADRKTLVLGPAK